MKNEWFGISVYQEGKEKELKQATSQKRARASQRLAPTAPRETSKQGALETGLSSLPFSVSFSLGLQSMEWFVHGGLNLSRNNSTTTLRNVSPR